MSPFWEWVVGVSTAVTTGLLLAAPLWWTQLREVHTAVLGRHGGNGLKREFAAFVVLYQEKHEALAAEMRSRFHDERGEIHKQGLELEARLRVVERQVAVLAAAPPRRGTR